MIFDQVRQDVVRVLGKPLRRVEPVGGGCIARGSRVEIGGKPYFLKWGDEEVARTFPAEAHGLSLLREAADGLVIPAVIAFRAPTTETPWGWLLLEWIEPGTPREDFWELFGEGLAALHRVQAEQYGLDSDNYIGLTPQRNRWHESWPDFFREERLMPQMLRAREQGVWEASWNRSAECLLQRLEEWLPLHPEASLLHGDLWSGNYLVTQDGRPALIDPAVYFGHREADLAMTELFGGFAPRFYRAYAHAWPLEPDYELRRDLYNLYHMLNHLNLFGHAYASGVARILKRYGGDGCV